MFANLMHAAAIIGALPVTLTNGTTADATQVMSDLNWIVNQVNANAAPLTDTARLSSNNNFTVAQSGVAASDPANFPIASQIQNNVFQTLSSTLGTNALTARIAALPLAAYAVGQVFSFHPSQGNTGSVTIDIDGLGSAVIKSRGSQLLGGELGSGNATIGAVVQVVSAGAQPVLELVNEGAHSDPGSVKAWMNFDGTTGVPRTSYNCSLTKNGTGDYTITISPPFPSALWVANITTFLQATSANNALQLSSQTASAIRFLTIENGVATDKSVVNFSATGYQ